MAGSITNSFNEEKRMKYETMRTEAKVNDDYLKEMETLLKQAQAEYNAAVAETARLCAEMKQAKISFIAAIQD